MTLLLRGDDIAQSLPSHWTHIEFELDHLRILCPLLDAPHGKQPEIRDSRLSCWLRAKLGAGKLDRCQGWFAMLPVYEGVFRLVPADNPLAAILETVAIHPDHALAAPSPKPVLNPFAHSQSILLPKPPRSAPRPSPSRANRNRNLAARAS